MRQSGTYQKLFYIGLTVVLLLSYNNCSQPVETTGGSTDLPSTSTDTDDGSNSSFLLQINDADPLQLPTATPSFNVAGLCHDDGEFDNQIRWVLRDVNGGVSYLSGNDFGVCDQGRFTLYVRLAQDFDKARLYVLDLTMHVYDNTDEELGTATTSIGVVFN